MEILGDEADDEFADYYKNVKKPKIMITTRPKCSKKLFEFIGIFLHYFSEVYMHLSLDIFIVSFHFRAKYSLIYKFINILPILESFLKSIRRFDANVS